MIRAGTDSRSEPLALPTITIFDLEYTAWECSMARHWLVPGEFKEVVQIGAVRLDADTLTVLDELEILVRPRINPHLSPYFETLTAWSGRGWISRPPMVGLRNLRARDPSRPSAMTKAFWNTISGFTA